jgi:large subunit ribosomal protein L12
MEYIYTAMLLHKSGQKVDEASVTKVLEAANVKVDNARVKALVAALDGVDIEKAIKETVVAAPVAQAAPAADGASEAKAEDKKEEKKEEKNEEQAAAGLGALFG